MQAAEIVKSRQHCLIAFGQNLDAEYVNVIVPYTEKELLHRRRSSPKLLLPRIPIRSSGRMAR
jgi:hypothetical protein